uniref:Uncharacterized protein n=1 Tax=Sphaerodactylus townsendi TaxID=933632 RepID=A0ACB8E4P1_9SAUR
MRGGSAAAFPQRGKERGGRRRNGREGGDCGGRRSSSSGRFREGRASDEPSRDAAAPPDPQVLSVLKLHRCKACREGYTGSVLPVFSLWVVFARCTTHTGFVVEPGSTGSALESLKSSV